jgi:hypothetical protein
MTATNPVTLRSVAATRSTFDLCNEAMACLNRGGALASGAASLLQHGKLAHAGDVELRRTAMQTSRRAVEACDRAARAVDALGVESPAARSAIVAALDLIGHAEGYLEASGALLNAMAGRDKQEHLAQARELQGLVAASLRRAHDVIFVLLGHVQ